MTESDTITLMVSDGVATLQMTQPQRRNALSPQMIAALHTAFNDIASREDISVVILTGSDAAFCAGLDIQYLATLGDMERVSYMRSAFELFMSLYSLPQPTIAAVNGAAVAGGFDLAAFCDMRLCSPNAVFGQPEVKIGVTQFIFPLHTLVGMGRAKELALTGDAINAEYAYRIGLVNHIYPLSELLDEAHQLANRIAASPREAVVASKATANRVALAEEGGVLAIMRAALDRSIGSESHRSALKDYLERYRDRE